MTVAAGILSFISDYDGMITEIAKRKKIRVEKVEENNFSLIEAHGGGVKPVPLFGLANKNGT
ncbi:MAG: hypothetical protein VX581_08445 [Chloroflexota bacterium]|nr:hypothetical protein [Chloroflexota bacterium]